MCTFMTLPLCWKKNNRFFWEIKLRLTLFLPKLLQIPEVIVAYSYAVQENHLELFMTNPVEQNKKYLN